MLHLQHPQQQGACCSAGLPSGSSAAALAAAFAAMQVYPESSGHGTAAFASATAGYGVGRPVAVMFIEQPPPPSYPPPAYEPPATAYGLNPSSATAPVQYGASLNYSGAPTSYGYPHGPVAPQTQHQNGQNVQVNLVNSTASPVGGMEQAVSCHLTRPRTDMLRPRSPTCLALRYSDES